MIEPINLFDVEGERFPMGAQLLEAMRYLHATFEKLWPALEITTRHVGETTMGLTHDGIPISDEELAFHALACDQIEDTLNELVKKCRVAATLNEERSWNTITNRGSMGMIAFGKVFEAIGDMIPKQPKDDTPEYDELIAWAKQNGYAELVGKEYIGFKNMQAILLDRAENKQPRPPHVTATPKKSIKIKAR